MAASLALLTAVSAAGDPRVSLESTWSARQTLGPRTAAGVETSTAVSGFTSPGLWSALAAGVEASTSSTGRFSSLSSSLSLRAGVLLPTQGVVLVPWLGGSSVWTWAPKAEVRWDGAAGLDVEGRLWAGNAMVAGLSAQSNGAWVVSLGFRSRTSWALPPPPASVLPVGQSSQAAPPAVPPSARIALGTTSFSPDGDGSNDVLEVSFETQGSEPLVHWSWSILAPGNQVFFRESGEGPPPASRAWNGVSLSGELVSSATDYQAVVEVEDELGRTSVARVEFTTDVLLLKDRDRYLIRLPSINFVANSPGVEAPRGTGDRMQVTLLEQNAAVIRRLAEILRKFPQYSITIVGHANLVFWADPARAKVEDRTESQPLSLQRAQAVKAALVELGLEASRIKTEGAGGSRPLFPFGDIENAWKNRRVDIILDRKAGP